MSVIHTKGFKLRIRVMKTNILAALLALMLVIVQLFVLQSRSTNHKSIQESTKASKSPHSLSYESQLPAAPLLSYDMQITDDLHDSYSSDDIHTVSSFNLQLP